jgi:ABC-type antimicrobial peptide transport system permease subunit
MTHMRDSLPNTWLLLPLLGGLALVVVLMAVGKVPLGYNLRNLMTRWKTTLVTALAFTVVIGLLTVMLAFVAGMNKLTEGSGQPGNVIALMDGATDEAFSNITPDIKTYNIPTDVLKLIRRDAAGKPLISLEVYVIVSQMLPNPVPDGPKRRFVQMRGLESAAAAAAVHGLELTDGRWWNPAGVDQDAGDTYEVVLGEGIARTFGQDEGLDGLIPLGRVLVIGDHKWKVVGILKSSGTTYGSEVWTLDRTIQQNFGRKNSYSCAVFRSADGPSAAKLAEGLKKMQEDLAVQAMPETVYFSKLGETNQQFLIAILFVAAVMAVGGVLGVMNTMFAAISQRTKDIGVLRLLGFTRGHILTSFLLESLLIALAGGLLGCAIGYLANGVTATSIVSGGPGGGNKSVVLRLVVDANILATGMLFTLFMGGFGGLIPSLSAVRLKPLESLR